MSEEKRPFLQRIKKSTSDQTKNLTMRQVFSVSTPRSFPSWKQWKQFPSTLSQTEQWFNRCALWLMALSLLTLGLNYIFAHRVSIPALGGAYTEGLIGEPQFINPLYASTNDVDADLSSLVYSGLLRWTPESGLIPDLAEAFSINEEKTTYTFRIREHASFHNGEPVRAQDVLFTVSAIQNPAYRSPLLPAFKGITVNQDDERTVSFVLEKPMPTFLDLLTIGILPASVWAEILPQNAPLAALNLQPIGSGPYVFSEFSKDKRGSIRSYTLEANTDFYDQTPHIEQLTFKFYPDVQDAFDAFEQKYVEGISVIPFENIQTVELKKTMNVHKPYLPQEVVLFFNQKSNEYLKDLNVRSAIAHALDRGKIIETTLHGNARILETPLLPTMIGYQEDLHAQAYDLAQAQAFFEKVKITPPVVTQTTTQDSTSASTSDETSDTATTPEVQTPEPTQTQTSKLTITLTTLDRPEYLAVAEVIQEQLAAINIAIEIITVIPELFASEVVATRNYELLLGSVLLPAVSDPYLFWHSSQIQENGLNLAGYQNKDVDAMLEKIRTSADEEERLKLFRSFQEQILKDIPALFLYQSVYPYATPKSIQQVVINRINTPQDRFANIRDWYIKTKKILK